MGVRLLAPFLSVLTARGLTYALLLPLQGVSACSTVEPGGNPQLVPVVYDENFFFCQVEPLVLLGKSCASGDPAAGDRAGSCHSGVPSFPLVDHPPTPCNGLSPSTPPSAEARQNLGLAELEMSPDVESAALLVRPTGPNHPRVIFQLQSPEADVIRQWATRYASQ